EGSSFFKALAIAIAGKICPPVPPPLIIILLPDFTDFIFCDFTDSFSIPPILYFIHLHICISAHLHIYLRYRNFFYLTYYHFPVIIITANRKNDTERYTCK